MFLRNKPHTQTLHTSFIEYRKFNLKQGLKMKKFSLTALIAGAMLFITMGATSLSAEMKCGAGKCGAAMEKPKCCKTPAENLKAPGCKCDVAADCKCGPEVKCTCKDASKCTCEKGKKAPAMKCGAGKCGGSMGKSSKAAPKEAMKCGTGKCG